MTRFALMVPTLNAEKELEKLLPSLAIQSRQPDRFIVIDSSSDDRTVALMSGAGAEVHVIARSHFNHGGTRMDGVTMAAEDCDIIVFLTQDVILKGPDVFEKILAVFEDKTVASAYGRQLPHEGANAIESYSRMFSYGTRPARHSKDDIQTTGFRTAFSSNAFSAFRITALQETGGFPQRTIFGEDALAVAELILSGHLHCYVPEAVVHHSHSYTLAQEFRRYFDIGVMHAQNHRLISQFGSPSGAGLAFVLGEQAYLLRSAPLRCPEAIIRTALKYVAYKLGRFEDKLSLKWKRRLSMHKNYWITG